MILVHTRARDLRNGQHNPKNYPYWPELIEILGSPIVQIGAVLDPKLVSDFRGGLPLKKIERLLHECEYWVSIDSFLPHLAHHVGKPGVVLWSVSDPAIFGYPENLNLLNGQQFLRKDQFEIWEKEPYNAEAFMPAASVAAIIHEWQEQGYPNLCCK